MMYSVLISVYVKDNPCFFRQSLDSILNQTLSPDEIILVKDGPLTKELDMVIDEYVNKYSIFKVIPLLLNQGLGIALNQGLKYCSYDIVARMDSDDIAKSDRFEKQLRIFQKYPDIDVVGSWVDEFEVDISQVISVRKLPETHDEIVSFSKKRSPLNHPTVVFKKQAVIKAGGYKHFLLFEDYYLWVRMIQNGSKFYNCQESLLYFRSSQEMFRRRGGIQYALNEVKLQIKFKEMGFISFIEFYRNVVIRFILRVIPNKMRAFLYKKILRRY
ncbi:glycosyltransferase [Parabacteroides sp. APC149_11_2_Y6]